MPVTVASSRAPGNPLQVSATSLDGAPGGGARALGISPHTVNDHLENAFRKVGVRRRQDLALALGCA